MTDILTDLSEPALVGAAKNNLYRFLAYMLRWEKAELYQDDLILRWYTPLPHPWFNGVLSRNALPGQVKELIVDTLAYFKDKDRQVITWWLAPELEDGDWSRQLVQNGLGRTDDPPRHGSRPACLE